MNEEALPGLIGLACNSGILGVLAIQDIRNKSIELLPLLTLALINGGLCLYFGRSILSVLISLLPGMAAILISFITKGKLGTGDGLVLIATGLLYDWDRVMAVWLLALVMSAFTGIVLIIMKKANIKTALPFIPFLLAGYVILEAAERMTA